MGSHLILFGGHWNNRGTVTYMSETVTLDLHDFDVQKVIPWNVVAERGSWPKPRSGHTAVSWESNLIVLRPLVFGL